MLKIFVVTFVFAHLNACIFSFMARLKYEQQGFAGTWVNALGLRPEEGIAMEYLSAMYWSITTFTTVGYGDVLPQTNSETVYTIVIQCVGVAFYGYVLANFTDMVTRTTYSQQQLTKRLEAVRCYVRERGMPRSLQSQVRLRRPASSAARTVKPHRAAPRRARSRPAARS